MARWNGSACRTWPVPRRSASGWRACGPRSKLRQLRLRRGTAAPLVTQSVRSIGRADARPPQLEAGMAASSAVMEAGEKRGFVAGLLDGIERLGNRFPHPVLMFLYLIGIVIALSAILALAGVKVTETITEPVPYAADK